MDLNEGLGRAARRGGNAAGMVGMASEDEPERMRKVAGEAVARQRAHECVGVREHIRGPLVVDRLRRIEVRACG